MNPLKWLSKPEGALVGLWSELTNENDRHKDIISNYLATQRYGGGAVDQAELERAQQMVGNNTDTSNSLDALLNATGRGWDKAQSYSEMWGREDDSLPAKALLQAANVAGDPLNILATLGVGSKVAKQSPTLEKLVEGAGSLGKQEDRVAKLGQFGRRYFNGLQATKDPLTAIPVAFTMGGVERGASSLAPAITRLLGKTGAKTVEEAVDEVLKGPADTVAKNIDGAYAKSGDELLQEVIAKRSDYEPNFVRIAGELPAGPPPPDYRKFVPKELNAGPAAGVGKSAIPMGPIKPDEILMLNKGESPLALPRGARVQGPPEGAVPLDEALQSILGTRQASAYAAGDRPDAILRALLESNRSGKGKFLNAEQKRVLQNFIDNPDALGQLMRMYAG